MKRRAFVKSGLGALASISLSPSAFANFEHKGWFNGFQDHKGRFGVAHISNDHIVTPLFYTPQRLHGLSVHKARYEVVAPSRRPGRQLFVFDIKNQSTRFIEAPKGRHFFGHGLFSADQDFYFTTESAYEEERGVIGVYDVRQNYKRIAEFNSHGIGPHEARLSKDGKKLVVANGGILTHPDMGRAKLNLKTMAPNLSYIDLGNTQLTQQLALAPELHQLSIRHMDIGPDDTAYIGLQDQKKYRSDVPLVYKTDQGKLVALDEPEDGWKIFKGYVGSVRANTGGVCVTSPHGNLAHIWGERKQRLHQRDICGLAPLADNGFLMTTGQGKIIETSGRSSQHPFNFDNHCA